ncbi:P-loop containing nucleoside triphosphate hydrolase protein [Xylaria digitata]|nr:P-loop containing nucleoside triphosphate hydrolase protein [Xylaria digitata]
MVESYSEITTVYDHSASLPRYYTPRSELRNPIAEETRLKMLGKKFGVICRESKIVKGDIVAWVTTFIEVHSPQLKAILDEVFNEYPSWYLNGSPYAVATPFKPYVHRWDRIQNAISQNGNMKELRLLRRELRPRIEGQLYTLDQVRRKRVISFEDLWAILNPGCLMILNAGGDTRATKLLEAHLIPKTESQTAQYNLKLAYVDWNGEFCGLKVTSKVVCDYEGLKQVALLPAYPAEFHPDWKEVSQRLISRGRKFESLRGYHIRNCSGKMYTQEMCPIPGDLKETEKSVSGRVIIDAYAYYTMQGRVPSELSPLVDPYRQRGTPPAQKTIKTRENQCDVDDTCSSSNSDTVAEYRVQDVAGLSDMEKSQINSRSVKHLNGDGRKEDLSPLTDFECMISCPRVKGFHLSTNEWCEFDVESLGDIVWDDTLYDDLVLVGNKKNFMSALVNRLRSGRLSFDDFNSKTGENPWAGINIILSGPSGSGKALTAEAVAEKSHVPLYTINARNLGTEPAKVEKGITDALKCCQLWDAVLLIDQADIFLESRNQDSLQRNEIVYKFLSALEKYRGLTFLTGNRDIEIDSAFKCIIDLTLPYIEPDQSARRRFWVEYVQKLSSGRACITDANFDKLSKLPINGKEIQKYIKMALVLVKKDEPLRIKHLKLVLDMDKHLEIVDEKEEDKINKYWFIFVLVLLALLGMALP